MDGRKDTAHKYDVQSQDFWWKQYIAEINWLDKDCWWNCYPACCSSHVGGSACTPVQTAAWTARSLSSDAAISVSALRRVSLLTMCPHSLHSLGCEQQEKSSSWIVLRWKKIRLKSSRQRRWSGQHWRAGLSSGDPDLIEGRMDEIHVSLEQSWWIGNQSDFMRLADWWNGRFCHKTEKMLNWNVFLWKWWTWKICRVHLSTGWPKGNSGLFVMMVGIR